MKWYKSFMENKFMWVQLLITLIVCVAVLGYMIADAKRPLPSSELAEHNANLQLIKEDFANITKVDRAEVTVANNQSTVLLKGADCTLKAVFDADGNCISSKTIDNRPGSSIGQSVMLTLMTFVHAFALTYIVKCVCYLPILLFDLVKTLRNKFTKKE